MTGHDSIITGSDSFATLSHPETLPFPDDHLPNSRLRLANHFRLDKLTNAGDKIDSYHRCHAWIGPSHGRRIHNFRPHSCRLRSLQIRNRRNVEEISRSPFFYHARCRVRWGSEGLGEIHSQGQRPSGSLLNNAAVINQNASLWQVSAEEFDQVIDINIKGVANVIRHFVPEMIKQGRGVIVNFSSGWGRSVDAEVAPYCATKWAIEGLTLALAQELPSGMAAVPLNPGIINTDMLQSCFGQSASGYMGPEEWAKRAVPFLLKLGGRDNGKQSTV